MKNSQLATLAEIEKVEVQHDLILLDETDERALINLVPRKVKDSILEIAQKHPEYLEASEVSLQEELKPSELDDRLRLLFWKEYNRAQDQGVKMNMPNIYAPVMSRENFYTRVLVAPKRVAWMIKAPEEYMTSLEASLNHGKNNLDKIMKMNLFDGSGNIDIKKANTFLKAYELLDNRVKGSVIQKTANLHVHQKVNEQDLRSELEQLREKQATLDIGGIDVGESKEG